MSTSGMRGLSIILCSFNPEQKIFDRVLNAISQCRFPDDLRFECIVIDNNSAVPLAQQPYVNKALAEIANSRIIIETQQGLTSSRKRGIRESVYDHLLFVDDDNELAPDYIVQLVDVINRYPFIGACNAGKIQVEFIGDVDPWFPTKGKIHFQESRLSKTVWGNDSGTFRHWPFGTGLMIKKDVALHYLKQTENGRFTLADRKGKLLTSGGDGQLVASALELGYSVGRIKELHLKHLISSEKATISYLTRQDYGIYFSNEIFMKECYPENFKPFSVRRETWIFLKLFFFDVFRFLFKRDLKKYAIAVATTAGTISGKRMATGRPAPLFSKLIEALIIKK
jgi:glycosyltransferase involved in cell wall biosynthesis